MIPFDSLVLRAALAWTFLYAPILLSRGRRARGESRIRADRPLALLGLALQCAAIAISIVDRRGAPVDPLLAVPILVFVTGAGTVTVGAAARRLGHQWSLTARLRTGHRLVTGGPYALVRHPIYTATIALFGALVAVQGGGVALTLGTALMLAGTVVRVRSEEALLTAEFGRDFRAWAGSIPAVVPVRGASARWAVVRAAVRSASAKLLRLLAMRSRLEAEMSVDRQTTSSRS